jgi:hypothetical protein
MSSSLEPQQRKHTARFCLPPAGYNTSRTEPKTNEAAYFAGLHTLPTKTPESSPLEPMIPRRQGGTRSRCLRPGCYSAARSWLPQSAGNWAVRSSKVQAECIFSRLEKSRNRGSLAPHWTVRFVPHGLGLWGCYLIVNGNAGI